MKKFCVFLLFLPLIVFGQSSSDRGDILKTKMPALAKPGFEKGFEIKEGQNVVFVGAGNLEFEDRFGWLESRLRSANKGINFTVRNISWEGDTVFERQRDFNYGSLIQHLAYLNADIVFLQFGQAEVFENEGDFESFKKKYLELIERVEKVTGKIVILSPLKMERSHLSDGPDLLALNGKLNNYCQFISDTAKSKRLIYIDLFNRAESTKSLTRDGFHLTEEGHEAISMEIAGQLKLTISPVQNEVLFRKAIVEKNHLWREFYRPQNWAFAYGDRTHVSFGKNFNTVAKSYKPLLDSTERQLHEMNRSLTGKEITLNIPPEFKHSEINVLSPEEQLKQMEISNSNFQFNLFASEKDGIINPVRMKWDRFGRLWVCCIPCYPQPDPGRKAQDYILICEDTDNDGKADKFTRFIEDVYMPMGIEFDNDGVYVCEGPDLVYYQDKDHDGKPESKTILLSGFGTGDSHQNINSITWGHDGQLWFTQGYHAFANVETAYGVKRLGKSGVFRYNPKTGKLETFFGQGRAGYNCWGTKTNEWGETIHISGADPALFDTDSGAVDITEGPNQPRNFCHTPGRKKCDMEFISTKHFPEELQGQLWTSTFYSSQINVFDVKLENGVWKSKEIEAVIPRAHRAFRPLEIKTGPQGALYVLDWYNEIIGHYQASYNDPRRDKMHGRIWRITYKGRPLVKYENLEKLSIEELIPLLNSDEIYKKRIARQILFNLPKDQVLAAADKLDENNALSLNHKLSLYQSHEAVNEQLLERCLNSQDDRVRAAAVLAIGRWTDRLPDPLKYLRKSIVDKAPRVRSLSVVAASNLKSPECIELITSVMDRHCEWTHLYAARLSALKTIDFWLPKLPELAEKFDEKKNNFAIDMAFSYRRDKALSILDKFIHSKSPKVRSIGMRKGIQFGDNKTYEKIAESAAENGKDSLEFLKLSTAAKKPAPKNAADLINSLINNDGGAKLTALKTAGYWGIKKYHTQFISMLLDKSISENDRIELVKNAVNILSEKDYDSISALMKAESIGVRSTVSHLLFELSPKKGGIEVVKVLTETKGKDQVLGHLNPFTGNAKKAALLADSLTNLQFDGAKAREVTAILQGTGYKGKKLLNALKIKAGESKPTVKMAEIKHTEENIKILANAVNKKGDAARGEKVYYKAGMTCVACHKIGENGGSLGPALTLVGRALPLERVIESILWPAAEVKEGFNSTTVHMKDGSVFQGYLKEESPAVIKILNPADGKIQEISKSNSKKITQGGTLMPENLLVSLSEQEKLDLFAFVAGLGNEKKPVFKKEKASLPENKKEFEKIFNGKNFEGWDGDLNWFRIESESVVAGNLTKKIPHNFFLTYKDSDLYNFELHIDFKFKGTGKVNGGIQFRSQRIPNHHEMTGYQADIYDDLTGNIYDESRRRKFVNETLIKDANTVLKKDDWNHYVIECKDNHIRLYLNGYLTADYIEKDKGIAALKGTFGLQVHGGPPVELNYKNIYLKKL